MHVTPRLLAFAAIIGFSVSDARQQQHDIGEIRTRVHFLENGFEDFLNNRKNIQHDKRLKTYGISEFGFARDEKIRIHASNVYTCARKKIVFIVDFFFCVEHIVVTDNFYRTTVTSSLITTCHLIKQ